jgi:hypothetical protein
MSAATPQYGALTLAVTLAASLAANNVVVGFVCGESNRGRLYMPFNNGLSPQTGDAANKWLPKVGTVTSITDPTGAGQVGQYKVTLIPGTADTVNVASVQTVYVDADTVFITATSTW